jgi:hypothetical protein
MCSLILSCLGICCLVLTGLVVVLVGFVLRDLVLICLGLSSVVLFCLVLSCRNVLSNGVWCGVGMSSRVTCCVLCCLVHGIAIS